MKQVTSNSFSIPAYSLGDQPNDLDFDTLSPAAQYQKKVEMINALCEMWNIDKSNEQKINESNPVFQIEGNKIVPIAIGAAASGKTIHDVSNHFFSATAPSVSDFRSPTIEKAPSGSSLGIVIATTIASIGVIFATAKYHQLAQEIRKEILQAFQSIPNNNSLLETTEKITKRKEQIWFNAIFEQFNPIPTCYLLLTKGIAFDAASNFKLAQQQYQKALEYQIDEALQQVLQFACARSHKLSGMSEEKDTLDEENVPFAFKCPITQDMMADPVFYIKNNHKHYFEYKAIVSWIEKRHTCPITNQPLQISDLTRDDTLTTAIQLWKQIHVKNI